VKKRQSSDNNIKQDIIFNCFCYNDDDDDDNDDDGNNNNNSGSEESQI
jgi:hypothetical protein